MHQLVSNPKRHKDEIEQISKHISAIDQDKVMERTGIGHDAAHLLRNAAETFQIGSEFFAFARAKCLRLFQKAVGCKAIQSEQFANFTVTEPALAISLHNQRFKRLPRKLGGFGTQRLYQPVRN